MRGTVLWMSLLLVSQASPADRAFHLDAEALERATLESVQGLLGDDAGRARAAMDRVEEHCRRVEPGQAHGFERPLVRLDQALHMALDQARRAAGAGDVDQAFDDFTWVMRTCRQCHADVRGAAPSE